MLRGVQRQIIEINQPQSHYFEKVLLFVHPQTHLPAHKLQAEAKQLVEQLSGQAPVGRLRAAHRRKWRYLVAAGVGVLLLAAVLFIKYS